MLRVVGLAVLVLVGATACNEVPLDWTDAPEPAVSCAAWASPTGSDTAAGTQAAPVFSPRVLAAKLAPGQTGCFLAGTYVFTGECRGCIGNGGSPGNPITLRPAPGVAAKDVILTGQWWVQASANDVIIRDLTMRDSGTLNANLFIISGDRVTLKRNDLTNPKGICVSVGTWNAYSQADNGDSADDLLVSGNKVHDCGTSSELWHADPGASGWHGIYISKANRTTISDNLIYRNKWRGLQTWPYARNTVIERNVFDENATSVNIGSNLGEGFPWASQNVVVRDNIMSNATFFRPDKNSAQVHGNFPNDGVDRGNRVTGNCIFEPTGQHFSGYGYSQSGNVFADPQYTDRAGADFRIPAGSPCLGKGPRGIQPGAGTSPS